MPRQRRQIQRKPMPKKLPKNKHTWVSLARGFVKEWPEVLDGLRFTHMPVTYLKYVNIILKNNLTIHYDVATELKSKSQNKIAKFLFCPWYMLK